MLSSSTTKPMKSAIKSAINSVSSGGAQAPPTFLSKVKVPSLFLLWYMLNVYYNIVNKKVLNVVPAPITISAVQLLIGSIYWSLTVLVGLKPKPKLPCPVHRDGLNIGAAAFSHSCGQTLTVVSLGAGAVSFTHIVKALEPFFSAMVSIFFTKKVMHPNVYLSLIPVVGGVGLACLKELSYSHVAFFAALGSNLFFAVRAVKSKQVMQSEKVSERVDEEADTPQIPVHSPNPPSPPSPLPTARRHHNPLEPLWNSDLPRYCRWPSLRSDHGRIQGRLHRFIIR